MTDRVEGSMVRAFFSRRVRAMLTFSSHGDEGRLTEEFWRFGGQSRFDIIG